MAGAPDPFVQSFFWPVAGRAVSAGVTLGIFEALAGAPASSAELAAKLGLDHRGTEALLVALAALGYVAPGHDGRFANEAVAQRFLVAASPESIANFAGPQAVLHWDILRPLDDVIRTGQPYRLHEDRPDHPGWEGYIRGLWEIQRPENDLNAALVPLDDPHELVDVAGGHGGFAMAMCRHHPKLRATVVDLPPSARVGRRIVAEQGFEDRISFVEGDVFEVGLSDEVDVVSVFNLIHHLREDHVGQLVAMARQALRPGGCLIIGDSEKPVPGSPSEHGAVSSLLFYAWSGGQNFESSQIVAWLDEAGFSDVRLHRNERSPWRIVVTGRA
ncbi:MAG: methyltransferase domain-containing protein [Actinobacteria bacterium]|nr:methyltransferase domain-containing protein [Actinomycetota bacterium]